MRGIKIPQQDFVLKRQGGLMHEGGRICGTLWYMKAFECFGQSICSMVDYYDRWIVGMLNRLKPCTKRFYNCC